MGEDRMSDEEWKPSKDMVDNLEKEWYREYDYVVKTFASSGIPTKKSKLTKQGWHDAWLEMVSLCARALEYKDEANRRAKHQTEEIAFLEDELEKTSKKIIETADEYKKMVKSFDKLGEKYTKDTDALMKLLILLGRKIDE